jgi:hypothetical protein
LVDLPALGPRTAWLICGFLQSAPPVRWTSVPVGLQLASLPEAEPELVELDIAVDEDARLWEETPAPAVT